jgi:hypothetical protein
VLKKSLSHSDLADAQKLTFRIASYSMIAVSGSAKRPGKFRKKPIPDLFNTISLDRPQNLMILLP